MCLINESQVYCSERKDNLRWVYDSIKGYEDFTVHG